MPRITEYDELASVAPDDELVVVDVSDTTMAPSGTTKFVQARNMPGGIETQFPAAFLAAPGAAPSPAQPALILTEFQAGHGYTAAGAGSASLNDTTAGNFIAGTQAATITTAGAGAAANLSLAGGTAFSAAGRTVRLRLKVDDITHMTALNFFLGSSNFAANYKWPVQTSPAGSNYVISGEWLTVSLAFSDATVTGSPDRTALTDVRLQAEDDSAGTVTVHYQSAELVASKGKFVSFSFDDSYSDNGKPALTAAGLPATVFTIQSLIGGSGRLSLDDLHVLQDEFGWELASHAFSDADHAARFSGAASLTAAELESDARDLVAWGRDNGFRGAAGLAYPGGAYGLTSDGQPTTAILERYFGYARITSSKTRETTDPDPMRLRAITDISTFSGGYAPSNLTQAGGDLDKLTDGSWLILSFHEVVPDGTTLTADTQVHESDFQAIVNGVVSRGLTVMPVGDVLRTLRAATAAGSVALDSAASHIQPSGVQSAGGAVSAAAAFADHVHPAVQLGPRDHGLIAWNVPPYHIRTDKIALTPGVLLVAKVPVPACTLSKLAFGVAQAATALTAGQNFVGLFDHSGSLLDNIAADTLFAAAGAAVPALPGSHAVPAGYVSIGWLFNGTGTALALDAADASSQLLNLGLSAANALWGIAGTGLTAMPASISAAGSLAGVSNGAFGGVG